MTTATAPEPIEIAIPHLYSPETREHQLPFFQAMDSGIDRAVLVWHRRYGKDTACFNYMVKEAVEHVGNYYYFFPTYKQGRMVIWDGRGKDKEDGTPGAKFLDHIPEEIIAKKNNSEMKITLKNGSIIQIIGLDTFNSKMGTNPRGCVFSEYSIQNPMAWDHIRPILRENKGWAVFNFTPRGENHGFEIYEMARTNPKWYCSLLTVDDTMLLTPEDIQEERDSGMSEDMILQEFYCDFAAANTGSYYGILMREAMESGRITRVDHDPDLPVDTWWDLGKGINNAIWFTQTVAMPRAIKVIDFYQQNQTVGLNHYLGMLQSKTMLNKYVYGSHWAPHDIKSTGWVSGATRIASARKMGIDFKIVPDESVEDGIEAVMQTIPVCWFDEEKCKGGIRALKSYHRKWDDIHRVYHKTPAHDWASHPADAFRYMAIGHKLNELTRSLKRRVGAGIAVTKYAKADPFKSRREVHRRRA